MKSLLANPASRFHAAVAGWAHPLGYGEMYQLDLLDLLLMRWTGDKFKPVPRPWDKQQLSRSRLTASEAHKRLRPHLYKD